MSEKNHVSNERENLEYIKQILLTSKGPNSYPSIYFFWGCAVFIGYSIAEFKQEWLNTYWLIAAPVGMIVSAWLGSKKAKHYGQQDYKVGEQYLYHFGVTVGIIFIAILLQEYSGILLLISLSYCLAGIYLEKLMFAVGVLAALIHVGINYGLITSNLIVGVVFSLGFFATAWSAAKLNADASTQ